MDKIQTKAFLTLVNQHDPRVEVSPTNVDIWAASLGGVDRSEAGEVLKEHYRQTSEKLTPSGARRMVLNARTTRDARMRSRQLPAGGGDGKMTRAEWKAKYPGRWEELRAQGAAEQAAKFAPVDEYLSDFGGLRVVR